MQMNDRWPCAPKEQVEQVVRQIWKWALEIVEKKGNNVVIESPEKESPEKESPEKVQYQRNATEVKKFTPSEEQSANSNHEFELQVDHILEQGQQRNRRPPDLYGEWK